MCFIDALIVLLRGLTHWKAEGENCINYDFFFSCSDKVEGIKQTYQNFLLEK